uniref:Terminase n=1 Tax=virus sp. ctRTq15 TaxID=2828253 RepID=A0A8S5RA90_9VIRU|nr:MAG TPA: Terminase [virus sp. ctRTq15]
MNSELNQLIDDCEKYISQNGIDENIIETYYNVCQLAKNEGEIDTMLKCTARAKELIEKACMRDIGIDIFELEKYTFNNNIDNDLVNRYFDTLLLEAPHLFHSYLLYLEKDREESERFYQPKMKQLNKYGLIQAMQDLEDDKYNRLCISMPPGTQKTTLEKFFCSWIIGKHPKDYSLFFSHSNEITGKFYKGVLDITTDDKEYKWNVIFPNLPLQSTNAQAQEANFGKYKAFSSIQCSSIGAKNAGKVRTNRYLYCDDLIGSIEEALNPIILEKIWRIYGVDLKQRKLNEQVKEIIIMTRWSTKDIIGHIIELYGNDPKLKIISIPDIDPKTGKSNFDYEYNGMSVEFFNDQALTMDDISYRCLYKQDPIEREGLLYPENKIMRYKELPKTRIKRITGQCDTKSSGTDFYVFPCLVEFEGYEGTYYCTDTICNNSADYEKQYENSANLIVDNEIQDCDFEANQGGDRVANEVRKRVEEKGWLCNISDTATETNKEARIFQCSSWVLQHIVFKDRSLYEPKSDYAEMMSWLLKYSVSGKNLHDDVPDVFSNFALRMKRGNRVKKTVIMSSPV